MNSRVKIIIFAIIFMGLVFGADRILKMQSDINLTEKENVNFEDTGKNLSKVIEINSETFSGEVLNSDKKVLIDFYATWCEPCKMLSPIIEELAKERDDIKFVKIDVDKAIDLAELYNVYSIPTIVVIEDGMEKDRVVGLISKDILEDILK